MSGTRSGTRSRMSSPSMPWPSGIGPIASRSSLVRSGRDELFDPPVLVAHAERGVFGGHDCARQVDDPLQDRAEFEFGRDGERCLVRGDPHEPPWYRDGIGLLAVETAALAVVLARGSRQGENHPPFAAAARQRPPASVRLAFGATGIRRTPDLNGGGIANPSRERRADSGSASKKGGRGARRNHGAWRCLSGDDHRVGHVGNERRKGERLLHLASNRSAKGV